MNHQTRFVIFCQGRTGSKLLVQLLNSHPQIRCQGEILSKSFWNPLTRRLVLPFWRHFPLLFFNLQAAQKNQKAYGFKLFNKHCKHPGRVLHQMNATGWKIIHLWRRDVFSQAISNQVAVATHHWHRNPRQAEPSMPKSLHIEPERLLTTIANILQNHQKDREILSSLPHLDLIYEDHLKDETRRQGMTPALLRFLEQPAATLSVRLLPSYGKPYRELIENYPELEQAAQARYQPEELFLKNPPCANPHEPSPDF